MATVSRSFAPRELQEGEKALALVRLGSDHGRIDVGLPHDEPLQAQVGDQALHERKGKRDGTFASEAVGAQRMPVLWTQEDPGNLGEGLRQAPQLIAGLVGHEDALPVGHRVPHDGPVLGRPPTKP